MMPPKARKVVSDLIDNLFGQELEEKTRLDPKENIFQYWERVNLKDKTGMTAGQFFSKYAKPFLPKEFESYDYGKEPQESSRAARNNEILSLLMHRLADPETLESRLTPGGFAGSSLSAKEMRILLNPSLLQEIGAVASNGKIDLDVVRTYAEKTDDDVKNSYDVLDPMTLVYYNQQNQIAGTLIGVFANHNSNHMFASMAKELTVSDPIKMCGHSYNDLIHSPKGVDTSLTTAEFLAASVDAVKDPVLNFLNLNRFTADTGALLARLGYTSEEIGLLFNQPIIKRLCSILANDIYSDIDAAVETIMQELYPQGTKMEREELLTKENLATNISSYNIAEDKTEWMKSHELSQLAALAVFQKASSYAKQLSGFIGVTKFTAANSVGSTWGNLYHAKYVVRRYLKQMREADANTPHLIVQAYQSVYQDDDMTFGISDNMRNMNEKDYFRRIIDNPFAFEQCSYDMMKSFMDYLCGQGQNEMFYPYETTLYRGIREGLNDLTKSSVLNEDTINSIHDDILVWILSNMKDSSFDGNRRVQIPNSEDTVSAQDYYTDYFPGILYQMKHGNVRGLSFTALKLLDKFEFNYNSKEHKHTSISVAHTTLLSKHHKEDISILWDSLARSKYNTHKQLAKDLFLYCFFKHGFDFVTTSFVHLAPPSVKNLLFFGVDLYEASALMEGLNYTQGINNLLVNGRFNTKDHIRQAIRAYIRNHWDNNSFVYTFRHSDNEDIKKYISIKDDILKISIPVNSKNQPSFYSKVVFTQSEKGTKVVPAVMYNNELYELIPIYDRSESLPFNESSKLITEVWYRKADQIGDPGRYKKYSDILTQDQQAERELIDEFWSNNIQKLQEKDKEDNEFLTDSSSVKVQRLFMGSDGKMQKDCFS